jgi:hypothetical protein
MIKLTDEAQKRIGITKKILLALQAEFNRENERWNVFTLYEDRKENDPNTFKIQRWVKSKLKLFSFPTDTIAICVFHSIEKKGRLELKIEDEQMSDDIQRVLKALKKIEVLKDWEIEII